MQDIQPDVLHVDGDVSMDLVLAPGNETQFSIVNRSGDAAPVGVIDLVHLSPTAKGSGTALITWSESLMWWPNPMSPGESWQKVITIKNHSRSNQQVKFRFAALNR